MGSDLLALEVHELKWLIKAFWDETNLFEKVAAIAIGGCVSLWIASMILAGVVEAF